MVLDEEMRAFAKASRNLSPRALLDQKHTLAKRSQFQGIVGSGGKYHVLRGWRDMVWDESIDPEDYGFVS